MKVLMDIILAGIMKAHSFITFVLLTLLVNMGMACPIVLEQGHHSGIFKGQTYDEIDSSIGVVDISDDRANWVESKNESGINSDVLVYESSDAARGSTTVYTSASKGVTQYVGITNNLARRSAEHLASKGINIQPLMKGLSRTDARAVEQALIEIHGLGKNGGTLLNRINSISPKNPAYGSQLQRGYDLLKSIGY